ncbi:MAG: ribose-5-phosphate isomerase RpiA [Anaerolineae bacterium]|nr:ribose-5-phosphate isomerase RpiA [Anaerolineae bacterium]
MERLKREAAHYAVQFVESGMVVGLGAGSTASFAVRRIAQLLREGQLKDVTGVPCSVQVEQEAVLLGIPLTNLDEQPTLDLTIDGADEVDPNLDLIKGGGGAVLREKIVAQASHREMIVVDESKLSPVLGTRWAVPIEVIPFGWRAQIGFLEGLGARPVLRTTPEGSLFRTDQGNIILDCPFGPISQPRELACKLAQRAGVVEHGLFLGLATDVVIASEQGVRHLKRGEPT